MPLSRDRDRVSACSRTATTTFPSSSSPSPSTMSSSSTSNAPSSFKHSSSASTSSVLGLNPPGTTPAKSKRHSMPLSPLSPTGPRPLHLLDLAGSLAQGSSSPTSLLLSPTRPSSSSRAPSPMEPSRSSTPKSAKRQSTISYFSPDHVSMREQDVLVKRTSAPLQTTSLAAATGAGSGAGTRASVEVLVPPNSAKVVQVEEEKKDRPLTSAEKHAELLHFIAQKEAKCLELRSQLSMHEEELLQLKRKWERIINRGLERENSSLPSPLSPSYATNPKDIPAALMSLTTNPSLTLEGIREGVQGMSRLLAAGLSITAPPDAPNTTNPQARPPKLGVPSSARYAPSSSSTSPIPPSPLSISSTATPLAESPVSASAALPSANARKSFARHAQRESDSSMATGSSSSVRLSTSSAATSVDDEPQFAQPRDGGHKANASLHCSPQELIMSDTGASVCVSPNPAFLEQKARRRRRAQEKEAEAERERMERERDAWGANSDALEPEWDAWGESEGQTSSSPSPLSSANINGTKKGAGEASSSAPASSIPTFAGLASPQMSSWMGTMGKKLGGELQKGTSAAGKRASLMLSDMGQSFVSALTSPPSETPGAMAGLNGGLAASPSGSSSTSSPFQNGSDPMFGLVSAIPAGKKKRSVKATTSSAAAQEAAGAGASHTLSLSFSLERNASASAGKGAGAKSLLDDDEDEDGFGPMVASPSVAGGVLGSAKGGMAVMTPDNVKTTAKEEEEDEWNW
ncbi:hypothetical protein D9611_012957 [Ephemerocybe angulata]|uniref:Uncharacterized protein n=1 Tax=Ephemerocybe angulata TaxID=980116 RepID=A0A8H5FFL3_9AGAR|nr:hypothetical protein D9611_012957 [Tulosesus angulatus]